jgi:hypothetical protein
MKETSTPVIYQRIYKFQSNTTLNSVIIATCFDSYESLWGCTIYSAHLGTCFDTYESSSSYLLNHAQSAQFTVHIWGHVSTRVSLHQVIFWTMFKVHNLQCIFGALRVIIRLYFEPYLRCRIKSAHSGGPKMCTVNSTP